jgi:hypothetical protein
LPADHRPPELGLAMLPRLGITRVRAGANHAAAPKLGMATRAREGAGHDAAPGCARAGATRARHIEA